MANYIQESISNSVFFGTCINGQITISNYADANSSAITENSLRGALIICKGSVIGYVANNTRWVSGGFTAYVAYDNVTISGTVDVQFVFPIGRTACSFATISILACGMHPYDTNIALSVLSMGKSPIGFDSYQASLKIRINRNNDYDNETVVVGPAVVKARKGARVVY